MVIVAGWLRVRPEDRDRYLARCRDAIVAARAAPGCVAFTVAADPIEGDRVNVFEQWESAAAVEAFRGDGTPDDLAGLIVGAEVQQHEIAATIPLT